MLPADATLRSVLRGSAPGSIRAVASYQGVSKEVRVIPSGSIQFQASGEVQATTEVTVYGRGQSLVPKSKDALLAPYGQELALYRVVSTRGRRWEIPLGVYRISRAGDVQERSSRGTVVDWSVRLKLDDRFEPIRANDFLVPESPIVGNSVWAEIRRLSPIPVQQTLGDTTVPPATVYESRLQAITVLFGLLNAAPHLTREGVLTGRPRDAWRTGVPVFDIQGTITWSDEMTNDFYNQVRVSNPNDPTIVAYSQINNPTNPLAVSRAGGRTYTQAAPIYQTVAAAQAAADTILSRVTTQRSRLVQVECTPEALLLELGDVGWVRDTRQGRAVLGEVSKIGAPLSAASSVPVELIVGEEA